MSQSDNFWKVPSWEVPVDKSDKVEIFYLPNRAIISEAGWPESFWAQTEKRISLTEKVAQQVINLFSNLEAGRSARCHETPWGIAFAKDHKLICTVTLCFECSNAYVYTEEKRKLRAFNTSHTNSKLLLALLEEQLPLKEIPMQNGTNKSGYF